MDALSSLLLPGHQSISCIDMHTTGEPTRIVVKGYPNVDGTLLEQRAKAKAEHDHIRKRLILEPAGHADMYGAILRPNTELTRSGAADIGVIYMHNEGYSNMCGHATIALGRFLLDTHDLTVFPRRNEIRYEPTTGTARLNLHAPCGLVKVIVPVNEDGTRSDPTRPISFVSVPSFATGKDIKVEIPKHLAWPQIHEREALKVSFCYGGAFTCLVSVEELGFAESGLGQPVDIEGFNRATKTLKHVINNDSSFARYFKHPEQSEPGALYTLMVVDKNVGVSFPGTRGAETGLCFFADQQVDRSPTGSAVAARVAYAHATGELKMYEAWTYHSLVSNAADGKGGFVGLAMEDVPGLFNKDIMLGVPVRVKVQGHASYVGSHVLVVEKDDLLRGSGFLFNRLGDRSIIGN